MTGIVFILALLLWFYATHRILRFATRKVQGAWRVLAYVGAFPLVYLLPVADEIVGGFQFRALCEKNAVLHMGVSNPEGRTTRFSSNSPYEEVPGTAIRILHTHVEYHDLATGELVVAFDRYLAKGGLLVHALNFPESNRPITIGSPSCSPERAEGAVEGEAVHRTLKFSVIN